MSPTSPAPVRAAAAPLRLLLVEDDEGDAFLVSELLQEEDPSIEVRHVRSLAAAVDAVSIDPPDCVLLDLGLPDATGLGALERLRAAEPGVAHLVLTGDRDVQRGVEAVAAGAQDYLIKGSVDGDLNLPRKDGREVLEEVKADRDLRTIPVVVLTTSEAEEDILRSYDLHANAYVTSPSTSTASSRSCA